MVSRRLIWFALAVILTMLTFGFGVLVVSTMGPAHAATGIADLDKPTPPATVIAPPNCMFPDAALQSMKDHGLVEAGTGVNGRGQVAVLFVNDATHVWTIVNFDGSFGCLLTAGTDWQDPTPPNETPSAPEE